MTFTSSFLPATFLWIPSIRDAWIIKVENAPRTAMIKHFVGQGFFHAIQVFFIAAFGRHPSVLTTTAEITTVAFHELIAESRHQLHTARVLAIFLLLIDGHAVLHSAKAHISSTSHIIAASLIIPTIHNGVGLLEVVSTPTVTILEHAIGQGFV